MRIIFVRHGSTLENEKRILQGHMPGRLSSLGKRQAQHIAAALKDTWIDRIYSSDLKRALDTAKVIARLHKNARLVPTKVLREHYAGKLQGTALDPELRRHFDSYYISGKLAEHGVEPAHAFYARIRKLLLLLATRHNKETILLVSHRMAFRMFVAVVRNKPLSYAARLRHLPHGEIAVFEVSRRGKNFRSRVAWKQSVSRMAW